MKLVHFDGLRLGVLAGEREEQVVDVSDVAGEVDPGRRAAQGRLEALISGWEQAAGALREAAGSRVGVPLESVRLEPAVPRPGQLVCAAVNYLEAGRPEPAPFNAFLKSPTSIVGDGDTVELPPAEVTWFHFEPELALVIGKPAAHLTPETAMAHVFGYTPFVDVSARGLPGGFFLGKSWHTFAPLGPALVTADEVPRPNELRVALAVNDQERHTYSTREMARHIPHLLAEITRVIALEPGDVVATGVHHEGLAPVQGGDRVRVSIERLGPPLRLTVHDGLHRTW